MPPKRAAAREGSMSAQRRAVKRPAEFDAESDSEYRQRRERNNIAVKKSREKSRARAQMTSDKVEELRRENTELEGKVNILSKELELLKDLLVLRASKKNDADNREDAVTSQLPSAADSCSVASNPELINQDHGYVSQIKRLPRNH